MGLGITLKFFAKVRFFFDMDSVSLTFFLISDISQVSFSDIPLLAVKQMACLSSRQSHLLLHLIRVVKESGEKPLYGFERTFVGESLTRREANGLSVLSTKPFTSSLNPSHKGKGDSFIGLLPPVIETGLNPSYKGKGDSFSWGAG